MLLGLSDREVCGWVEYATAVVVVKLNADAEFFMFGCWKAGLSELFFIEKFELCDCVIVVF